MSMLIMITYLSYSFIKCSKSKWYFQLLILLLNTYTYAHIKYYNNILPNTCIWYLTLWLIVQQFCIFFYLYYIFILLAVMGIPQKLYYLSFKCFRSLYCRQSTKDLSCCSKIQHAPFRIHTYTTYVFDFFLDIFNFMF